MEGTDTMSMINALWPFVLMAGIFYFMLWRLQKKEQQRRQSMLGSLKKGDKVMTIGGIYGIITKIDGKKVFLEVSEGLIMEFAKNAVSSIDGESNEEN